VTPDLTMSGDHEVNAVFFTDACTCRWKPHRRGRRGLDHRQVPAGKRTRRIVHGRGGGWPMMPNGSAGWPKCGLAGQALEMIELKILSDIAKGRPPGPQTSLIKLLASNLRQDIDLLAVDLYGDRRFAA
jgi:hypothetical protein